MKTQIHSLKHNRALVPRRVLKIAWKIRKQCEKIAAQSTPEPSDFPFSDLCTSSDLSCMCAIASATLFNALLQNGFKPVFVSGIFSRENGEDSHCWIELNSCIIDLTATQFGVNRKVLITRKNNELYQAEYSLTTEQEIFNKMQDWEDQSPSPTKIQYILEKVA